MTRYIIVSNKPELVEKNEKYTILNPHEFISASQKAEPLKNSRIINLSPSYDYLSRGYYVSLLSEARGAQCFPDVENIIAAAWRYHCSHSFQELNTLLKKYYTAPYGNMQSLHFVSFFGRHENKSIEPLARRIFDLFRLPIAGFEIKHTPEGSWNIARIGAKFFNSLNKEQIATFNQDLANFTGSRWRKPAPKKQERYWLGILHDPKEKNSPSNPAALKKIMEISKKMDVRSELITKNDFSSILEYDALFIRETTAINNHTYRFAKKAELEGIPVIDDTNSIIKCCNKVFLNELLDRHKINTPRTIILDRINLKKQIKQIEPPYILKIPDGAFSTGVFKVATDKELYHKANELLSKSEIILCQEFLPSKYDWRIGILNNQALFASKYYMAENHWQIYNHAAKKISQRAGRAETVPFTDVPDTVLKTALQASQLIGDSLYGVDLKELEDGRVIIIEVNDNPNIDRGIEDKVLGDVLYEQIIQHIIRKIEE